MATLQCRSHQIGIPDALEGIVYTAARKFDDTSQLAIAYRLPAPTVFRAHRLEAAAGTIHSDANSELFVSLGPVWRLSVHGSSTFIDFGFSPTLMSGSRFDSRELGGRFYFTSSLTVGARFGRFQQFSLSLRVQHSSNGGLHGTNPGLDMLGLAFAVELRD